MKSYLTIIALLAGASIAHAQPQKTTISPNGELAVHFSVKDSPSVKGGLFWKIDYKGNTVMLDSQLGFTLKDAAALDGGFKILKVTTDKHDSTWKPVYGEASEYRNHYNETKVTLQDSQTPPRILTLTFRAYDEGIAYRTTFPKQTAFTELTVKSENTQFRFAGDHQAWITRNAQGTYEQKPLSKLNPKHAYERPFVMKTTSGTYLSVLEAGLIDFPRMRVGLDKRAPHAVVSRLSSPATIKTPYNTPWRVLMVATTPSELLQRNYLLLNLSPPNRIGNTSWIKPGKQMRDVTITKKGGKSMIDLAERLGLDYVEIDAGWYGDERKEESDPKTVTPSRSRGGFTQQDLIDVIAYGKSKGLGVIVYVNRRHLEQQLDEILPLYKKWGIAGLKYGFVQVGSQEWTAWLHDAVAKAAKYQMIVDAHDEYRPTGAERTFPNFLTMEGIRGNEAKPTPKQDLDTAFLRAMCGPSDFTMCWHSTSLKMSWPHQMAASVVYYSPLQTLYWYDQPKQFTGKENYLAFFRALPTVWDQKHVIQGEIGEFITIARRKGDSWFVGTMNAVKPRKTDIPLTFLTPGRKYTATIYSDDPSVLNVPIDPSGKGKGNTESKKLVITTMIVTSKTVIHATMANNGGQAIHLVPVTTGEKKTSAQTQIESLTKDYDKKSAEFTRKLNAERDSNKQRILFKTQPDPTVATSLILKLAKKNPKAAGIETGLVWALSHSQGAEHKKFANLLLTHYKHSRSMGKLTQSYARMGIKGRAGLRHLIEVVSNERIRQGATYMLATQLRYYNDTKAEGTALMRELFTWPDLEKNNPALYKQVKGQIFVMDHLGIGHTAPDITGADEKGQPFKLSDYRGRVVLLDFWGIW